MPYPYALLITEVTGNTLAATDYNNEHTNHINNNIPGSIGSDSANVAGMQATVDPYPSSVESLATDLKGELERLRYVLKNSTGAAQWYIPVQLGKLLVYRRPVLQYASATTVQLETGAHGTSGASRIIFPDGNTRDDSTSSHILLSISQVAVLSGVAKSGLRTGTVANNTWYACYAVKVTDSATDFVVVADTVLDTIANVTTLNANFGVNGWLYLGLIRYGDQSGAPSAILKFRMSGNMTVFKNACASNEGGTVRGLNVASTVSAASLTYTYAAGTAGAVIPNNISLVYWNCRTGAPTTGNTIQVKDAASTVFYDTLIGATGAAGHMTPVWGDSADGLLLNGNTFTGAMDIYVSGFVDTALGVGSNPLF